MAGKKDPEQCSLILFFFYLPSLCPIIATVYIIYMYIYIIYIYLFGFFNVRLIPSVPVELSRASVVLVVDTCSLKRRPSTLRSRAEGRHGTMAGGQPSGVSTVREVVARERFSFFVQAFCGSTG